MPLMMRAHTSEGGRCGTNNDGAMRNQVIGWGWEVQADGRLILYFYEPDTGDVDDIGQPMTREIASVLLAGPAIEDLMLACVLAKEERGVFMEATAAIRARRTASGAR